MPPGDDETEQHHAEDQRLFVVDAFEELEDDADALRTTTVS